MDQGDMMTGKLFGTDGIRGQVGQYPMTPDGVSRFAAAVAQWVRGQALPEGRDGSRHLVLTGGDTRDSSPWILDILSGTLAAHGVDVARLGIATTPQLAFETASRSASAGIMVTASHNPARDNGLKLFGADGFKLSNTDEAAIEEWMTPPEAGSAPAGALGRVVAQGGEGRYLQTLTREDRPRLSGLKLVVDAAHGAASAIAPRVFDALGADAEFIGVEPDGLNINDHVGATHTDALASRVREAGAFAGVALDGDADRLIMVDERGEAVDGDQLLGLLASHMQASGQLRGGGVVATVMSNLGLERHLSGLGLCLERTRVGDRHVVEAMRAGGYNLGGEQSGHIVLLDAATTGDGLQAALQVLAIAAKDGRRFSEIARVFQPVPQKLVNVRFEGADPLETEAVQSAIRSEKQALGQDGRVLVRKSGTEPLIRIMVEAVEEDQLAASITALEEAVRSAI